MTALPLKPFLYLITKGEVSDENRSQKGREMISLVQIAVDAGVSLIQLREKRLSTKAVFELAAEMAEITTGSGTRLFVNDRADVAFAAGADGVHLTSNSLPVREVKTSFPALMIGVSTHSIEEIAAAESERADFAVFGPVFSSPGKGEPTGVDELRRVCERFPDFPLIGLGGIDGSNYEAVLDAGASGVAAIRWLNDRDSIKALARRFRNG